MCKLLRGIEEEVTLSKTKSNGCILKRGIAKHSLASEDLLGAFHTIFTVAR